MDEIKSLEPLLGEKPYVEKISNLLKSIGETETIGEIKTASKLLRDLTATVGKKTWPVLAEIESTKEIIQNAGILSFLGNKKRSAKRKTSEWIARLSEKDPDERLIEELTKLIDIFYDYKNLKIAEFVEISSNIILWICSIN